MYPLGALNIFQNFGGDTEDEEKQNLQKFSKKRKINVALTIEDEEESITGNPTTYGEYNNEENYILLFSRYFRIFISGITGSLIQCSIFSVTYNI